MISVCLCVHYISVLHIHWLCVGWWYALFFLKVTVRSHEKMFQWGSWTHTCTYTLLRILAIWNSSFVRKACYKRNTVETYVYTMTLIHAAHVFPGNSHTATWSPPALLSGWWKKVSYQRVQTHNREIVEERASNTLTRAAGVTVTGEGKKQTCLQEVVH